MSNVSLELLRLFCIVAQTGKIYKAAESLYISQPAVTQSIKKLEEELGGALFYRTPKGVVLTEQGKSLYSFIKPSIDALENAPKKFSQYINLEEGSLKIKAGTTISEIVLFNPLEKFMRDYPKICVDVVSGRSSTAIEMVSNSELDMAIVPLPSEEIKENIDIIKYKSLELVVYSTKEYLEKNNIDINKWEDILKGTLILPTTTSNTGKVIYSFFQTQNLNINSKYIFSSNTSRKRIAKDGLGIGIGLKDAIKKDNFVISNLKLPKIDIGIIIQKKEIASFATLKLLEYIMDNK